MAAYTDQFDRHDPFQFDVGDAYRARLHGAVLSARTILWDRKTAELTSIAQEIERVVGANALELGRLLAVEERSGPSEIDSIEDVLGRAEAYAQSEREDAGELRLYIYDDETGEGLSQPALASGTKHEQALAVVALWMAVDFLDHQLRARETADAAREEQGADAAARAMRYRLFFDREAANCAMDAIRANEMALAAASFRMWSDQRESVAGVAAADVEKQAAMMRRRHASEAGRSAAAARWANKDAHMREAIALASSRPFKSRREAARFAVERIEKSPGEFYSEETVDGWLKANGWRSA